MAGEDQLVKNHTMQYEPFSNISNTVQSSIVYNNVAPHLSKTHTDYNSMVQSPSGNYPQAQLM